MTPAISTQASSARRSIVWSRAPRVQLLGKATEPASFAAEELKRYLEMIFGTPPSAVALPGKHATGSEGGVPAVQLEIRPHAGLSDEGYAWESTADGVLITAGGDLGLVFAVYAFLRDVCGCRFCGLGANGEFVPSHQTLTLSVAPVRREPKLWYRSLEFYYFEHPELLQQTIDWMAKNGFNYVLYHLGTEHDEALLKEEVDPKTGRKIFPEGMGCSMFSEKFFNQYLLPETRKRGLKLDFSQHNLCYWIPPARYAREHPEWFAEIDGKRAKKFSQLCLCTSNREMVAELIQRVKAFLREHPDVSIVGVNPEDGIGICQCEQCRAMDVDPNDAFQVGRSHFDPQNENRSATRRYARLLNEVARSLRVDFPHVLVSGMAYVDLQWPPRNVKLETNITMMVAVYWRDGARPLSSTHTSNLNEFFFDLLKQWRAVFHGRLLLYEYYMGMMAQRNLPYPMARVIGEDWNAMASLPIDGAMIQCIPGCIQSYMLNLLSFSRCAWGQPVDVEEQLDEYLRSVFGKAGASLRIIFERLQQAADALKLETPVQSEFDPRNNEQRVLWPEGKNIAYFWACVDSKAAWQSMEDARRLAKTPKEKAALEEFGKYLRYCELAAQAQSSLQRIERLEKTNPAEAQRLRAPYVKTELPAVISYLEANPLRDWILPRVISLWKGDLQTQQAKVSNA